MSAAASVPRLRCSDCRVLIHLHASGGLCDRCWAALPPRPEAILAGLEPARPSCLPGETYHRGARPLDGAYGEKGLRYRAEVEAGARAVRAERSREVQREVEQLAREIEGAPRETLPRAWVASLLGALARRLGGVA